jgi:hypothetical protein
LRLLLVVLAACAPVEPPPPPPGGMGTVEFVAVQDGAELELIPGAQGGFHVSIPIRVDGFDPAARVEVDRETRRDDTRDLVASTTFTSAIGEGGMLIREVPVFLCPAPVGISIADEPLEVSVEVRAGVTAYASVAFVAHCPTGDQADFCDRICRR